ncbi:GNAT family N-acetyltransferase [Pedobacter hartonius]|uniref:Acetyltransferase (GNAT) domain-containing protein n=1 Tax=Pedobacter hartonius TaxID=425514 RepID=A0A1H3WDR0_9SPHI|nr:GNAT family N-acetyltransferase [Pedobacter hartonius]SDZ84482.1 Acetyltransferase (GNAT) domain-containing protein [Pedobacter hartonius]
MTIQDNLKIRQIRSSEIKFLATFLSEIFFDNAAYSTVFPDLVIRKAGLEWLFHKILLLNEATTYTWIAIDPSVETIQKADDLIATTTLLHPSKRKNGILNYVQFGLVALPFKFGWDALRNLLKLTDYNDGEINRASNGEPFFYLSMVAVKKDHRGKGIATNLLNYLMAQHVDQYPDASGPLNLLLTTQLQSNVNLYQKLGFKVIEDAPVTEAFYPNWTMKKVIGGN